MSNVFSRGYWDDRTFVYSSETSIDAAKKYIGRVWYRTDNVRHGRVLVRIKYYNSLGSNPQYADRTMRLDSSADWTAFDFPLTPPDEAAPYDITSFRFQVYLDHSPGTVWVDDVGVWELTEEEWATFVYPFGRYSAPQITTTGALPTFSPAEAITVRQDGAGAWWFVHPDGTPFYASATGTGVNENDTLIAYVQTVLGLTLEEYRSLAKYRAFQDLGFNSGITETLGGSTNNYIDWLNFSTETTLPGTDWVLKDRNGDTFGGESHYFPDPFSATWQAYAVTEAAYIDEWMLESPRVIGYFTDNEWAYGEMSDYFWSAACQLAFVQWLQGTLPVPSGYELATPYDSISDINTAWSSSYHSYAYVSFAEIYGSDKPRIRAFDDPVATDLYAFERVVLKTYVDTVVGAIRDREQALISTTAPDGHPKLIFSCRIGWDGPDTYDDFFIRNGDILSAFDVIAVNAYPRHQHTADHHTRAHMETLKELFSDLTGRPVLVAEFGVAAYDAGVLVRRWRNSTVNTQAERGHAFHNISSTWSNSPWMIGQTWFKWANGYGEPEGSDPRNCGLVDDADQYYVDLTSQMLSTNQQLAAVRRDGGFDSTSIDWRPLSYPVYESDPPALTITQPDGIGDAATTQYTITWSANDTDGPASVTLFASPTPNVAANTVPLVSDLEVGAVSSFVWDLTTVAPGDYFIVGAISDGTGPCRWAESTGPITVLASSIFADGFESGNADLWNSVLN